jgi:hypothetical protein
MRPTRMKLDLPEILGLALATAVVIMLAYFAYQFLG